MAWMRTRKDEIVSIMALLGAALLAVGFGLTFWQLSRIEDALRVANVYQVQKDSRELTEKSLAVPGFEDFLRRAPSDVAVAAEERQRFETQINLLIDFYLAIFRQERMGGLAKAYSRTFASEFCNFVKLSPVQGYWSRKLAVGEFRGEHNRMRRLWCGTAPQV